MRTILLVFIVMPFTLFVACGKTTDRFSFHPAYPQAGQEVTVTYNPSGTPLEDAKDILLLAYCFAEETARVANVVEIPMIKSGRDWQSSFLINDTTLSIYIVFNSNRIIDDNEKTGYLVSIYDENQKPVKGGLASQAEISQNGSMYPFEFWDNPDKAKAYYEKEFKLYPEQKQNWHIMGSYWYLLYALDKKAATPIIKSELEKLAKVENKSAAALEVLVRWCRKFDEPELSQKYQKELEALAPAEFKVQQHRYQECVREKSTEEKLKLTMAFVQDFPHSYFLENLHRSMLRAYVENGQLAEAESYFNIQVKNPSAQLLSSLAGDMIENDILENRALEIAKLAVEKTREEMSIADNPGFYSTKQWEEEQNKKLMKALILFGDALINSGKIDEAVPVFKEATKLDCWKDRGIPERYCQLLYETGQFEIALAETQKHLGDDPLNENLQSLFQKVQSELNNSDIALQDFLNDAEIEYRADLKKEIESQLVDIPAPLFTLNDLDGQTVRLADYKGKIVILDFWATWCVWCIKGFPAMQKAINKYENDEDIKFLFIDTGESLDRAEDKIQKIIGDNNYSFHVLMDVDGSVSNAFNIPALPTKFIIGPHGNIRFRNRGFDNDSRLLNEIDLVIELIR